MNFFSISSKITSHRRSKNDEKTLLLLYNNKNQWQRLEKDEWIFFFHFGILVVLFNRRVFSFRTFTRRARVSPRYYEVTFTHDARDIQHVEEKMRALFRRCYFHSYLFIQHIPIYWVCLIRSVLYTLRLHIWVWAFVE